MAKSLRMQKILLERELIRLVNNETYVRTDKGYELKDREVQNIKQFTGFPNEPIKEYYEESLKFDTTNIDFDDTSFGRYNP